MADCAPEPARMQSKQWSTSDLMRGAGACAEIAGIDLNKLSREELVNMLKETEQAISMVPVKPEPASGNEDDETQPADTSEIAALSFDDTSDNDDPNCAVSDAYFVADASETDGDSDENPMEDLQLGLQLSMNLSDHPSSPIPASLPAETQKPAGASKNGQSSQQPTSAPMQDQLLQQLQIAMGRIAQLEQQIVTQSPASDPSSCATPQDKIRANNSPALSAPKTRRPDALTPVGKDNPANTPDDDTTPIVVPGGQPVVGRDALRMRLRRMCERKKSGKLHVKESILEDFKAGGERRELLEIALLEALRDVGVDRAAHKQVKQTFNAKVELVKERFQEREKEITGQWLTPERMRSQLCYNEATIKQVVAYCSKFPAVLTRSWKYNSGIMEYFVETDTTTKLKQRHLERWRQTSTQDVAKDKMESMTAAVEDEDFLKQDPALVPAEVEADSTNTQVEGSKVGEDLSKLMEATHQKISQIYKMVGQLEHPYNPKPNDRHKLLGTELESIAKQLENEYEEMAKLTTLKETGMVDDSSKLQSSFDAIRTKIQKPCSELCGKVAKHKLFMKDINQTRKKAGGDTAEDAAAENKKARKAPEESSAGDAQSVPSKKRARKKAC